MEIYLFVCVCLCVFFKQKIYILIHIWLMRAGHPNIQIPTFLEPSIIIFMLCLKILKDFRFHEIKKIRLMSDIYRRLLISTRSSHRSFSKKPVLKNLAILMEKHLCWSLFLIKLQDWMLATLLKRDSNSVAFLICFKIKCYDYDRKYL